MFGIGVIPQDAEIGAGDATKACHARHHGIGVHHSVRIGILGHAPHALDQRVCLQQRFDLVHVRAFPGHRDGNHVDVEGFADGEVPVIARCRTQKLHLATGGSGLTAPGRRGTAHAVIQGAGDDLIHELQAAVAAHHSARRRGAQVVRGETTGFGNAHDAAIVAAVGAIGAAVVAVKNAIQRVAEGQLLGARFAAGQVQVQFLCTHGVVLLA